MTRVNENTTTHRMGHILTTNQLIFFSDNIYLYVYIDLVFIYSVYTYGLVFTSYV